MSLFLDAFLGSRFSIDFLISSTLVSLNLNVWNLFLDLINLMLDGFDIFQLFLKEDLLLVNLNIQILDLLAYLKLEYS